MMHRCVGGGKIVSYHMGVCLILFIVALAELCQGKKGSKIGITESREKEVGGAGNNKINHCRGIANVFY